MSALKTVRLFDANTLDPKPDAAPAILAFVNRAGIARTPPLEGVRNLTDGLYGVAFSDADVTAGTAVLVDNGAGVTPRFWAATVHLDLVPFHALLFQAALDGEPWVGASPTVGSWVDANGAALSPPAWLTPLFGTSLYGIQPSNAHLLAGVAYTVLAPPGALNNYDGGFSLESGTTPGAGRQPDLDVAQYLAGALPGPSLGVFGTSIFRGPVRPAAPPSVPHQAIFCLATGGPPPQPYFSVGGDNANFHQVAVQCRVRSSVEAFGVGQTLALQVRDKAHLAQLVGYVACKVLHSTPLYLGQDDTEHHEWSVNTTVWFRQ